MFFFSFILPVFDVDRHAECKFKRSDNSERLCKVFLAAEASKAELSRELLIKEFILERWGITVMCFDV